MNTCGRSEAPALHEDVVLYVWREELRLSCSWNLAEPALGNLTGLPDWSERRSAGSLWPPELGWPSHDVPPFPHEGRRTEQDSPCFCWELSAGGIPRQYQSPSLPGRRNRSHDPGAAPRLDAQGMLVSVLWVQWHLSFMLGVGVCKYVDVKCFWVSG